MVHSKARWSSGAGQSESPFVTTTEVLSLTRRSVSLRLSRQTFLRFVASGQAPARVERRGGEPLWDRKQIERWMQDRLQPLLEDEARSAFRFEDRERTVPLTPSLSTVSLDPDLPTHRAVLRGENRLEQYLHDIASHRARLRDAAAQLAEELSRNGGDEHVPRRWMRRRPLTLGERQATVTLQIEQLNQDEARARADLSACRSWIHDLLSWAQHEFSHRIHRVLDETQLADEEDGRRMDLRAFETFSAAEFADQDPRRGRTDLWPGAEDPLTLLGMDFGYEWRHDLSDRPYAEYRRHTGTWRVSWIQETGELYGFDRRSGTVILIGRLPDLDPFEMMAWFRPLETRMAERNSLAVVVEALREQQRTGFAAFSDDLPTQL